MKTVGQLLKEARQQQKLEISDISRVTRIRESFLNAIEADDYQKLPSGAVAYGFIRNYGEYLNIKPEHLMAVFRRDFIENKLGQIIPRSMAEPSATVSFWTPKTTIISLVVLIFTLFATYLIYQYSVLLGPPELVLTSPTAAQISTTESTIEIAGKTDPEATISVGGELVALDKGGNFSFRVTLSPGENVINVVSTGKSKKTTSIIRRVTLTTP